jgi:hypothetical protein
MCRADAEFIAHAPDDIDWLIGEVARLSVEVAEVSAALDEEVDVDAAEVFDRLLADVASAELKAEHYHEEIVASHAERDRRAAELAVAVAALESGDACGAVGCRALGERDRLAAQVRAVGVLCADAEFCQRGRGTEPALLAVPAIRAVFTPAAAPAAHRAHTHDDPACCATHCDLNHDAIREEMRTSREQPMAECELWAFGKLQAAITRHEFHYHDCQTTWCLTRFIYDSAEWTEVVGDAYQRGFADALASAATPEPEGEQQQ